MSSYIVNGECISGACKSMELFQSPIYVYMAVAGFVILAVGIYLMFKKGEIKA